MNIKDKSDTKNKIFQAAAELFSRDGFHNVSVREICEAADVTKPVLYYYFKDKENLLFELVKDTQDVIDKLKVQYIYPKSDFIDILKGVATIYSAFFENYPHLIKFSAFLQFMYVPPHVREFRLKIANEGFGELIKIFKKAQLNGLIESDNSAEMIMQTFVGPIILIVSRALFNEQDIPLFRQNINDFVDYWINKFVIKKD